MPTYDVKHKSTQPESQLIFLRNQLLSLAPSKFSKICDKIIWLSMPSGITSFMSCKQLETISASISVAAKLQTFASISKSIWFDYLSLKSISTTCIQELCKVVYCLFRIETRERFTEHQNSEQRVSKYLDNKIHFNMRFLMAKNLIM